MRAARKGTRGQDQLGLVKDPFAWTKKKEKYNNQGKLSKLKHQDLRFSLVSKLIIQTGYFENYIITKYKCILFYE